MGDCEDLKDKALRKACEKDRRAWKKRKKPKDNEAASTDAKNVHYWAKYEEAYEEESRKERMKKAPKNIKAAITSVSVDRGKTVITIDVGEVDGVEIGMKAYLMGDNGKTSIELIKVEGARSKATVNATTDQVTGKPVTVNP